MPPILIELQYQVNQMFMPRLIKYSSNAYHRYKVLPIVLVNVTQSFSSTAFKREFTASEDGLLLETSCKFWAKQCVLLTAEAVSDYLCESTLNHMAALGCFLTRTGRKITTPSYVQRSPGDVIFNCKGNFVKRRQYNNQQVKRFL